ncbi:hypothetical protein EJ05DRAFT_510406 [Pseudovirgaria hyperparasitica]|uniref:Uncharacterized protein n=1 Tax=Pseudovirgaria hyperparasitica TaxID=470096 RepID=A0A6A6W7G6_9PEZI|nr:uncharacterized protein EJ05DRAFT_510406 [Pseudovirgaria hyperparasitica]KAF2758485.1 hypothetical protein EJ05DRAFT_510406 [Pseudovirgaria hyperparasitica]
MDFSDIANVTVGNHTLVGWVDGPDRRGTLSILISCLTTLLLCTWSAMHLNVPKRHVNEVSYIKTQVFWSLVGIFGPELAIWCAWRQYMSAKALRDQIKAALLNSGKHSSYHEEWTLTHGFYASMGGFVVDLDSHDMSDKPKFLRNSTRLTLTPKGILLLARCGYLPSIRREEIEDKSKTDGLGKFLACGQALWMTAQVIARLANNLPITLLEVTTLGHVLCALILYSFWWYKPRWIAEPTRLDGDWIPMICAFMCMASKLGDDLTIGESDFQERFAVDTAEISRLRYVFQETQEEYPDQISTNIGDAQSYDFAPHPRPQRARTGSSGSFVTRPGTNSHSKETTSSSIVIDITPLPSTNPTIDPVTLTRHDLASQAITTYPAIRKLMQYPVPAHAQKHAQAIQLYPEMPPKVKNAIAGWQPASRTWLECQTEHLVCTTASNWPSEGLLRPTGGLATGAALWFSSIAFAAIHIAAWHDAFPSVVEAWLWRASAVYLCFSGCLWCLIHVLADVSAGLWWLWYDLLTGGGPKLLRSLLFAVCSVCGVAYVFARLFLIVDSFVSLRSLPAAAFIVPQWAVNVPHV